MNYCLTALRQENAGLVSRVQGQATALRSNQVAAHQQAGSSDEAILNRTGCIDYSPGTAEYDLELIRWYRAQVNASPTSQAAPQPAPAPLSEMPYEKRKAIQEGEQIGASDAWFKARHEMLDTVDRRNVFRAGFDRGWSAAIAAQGGKA